MQHINCTEPGSDTFSMCENMPGISEELFWSIILACPKDGVILELGSGATTAFFAQHRKIYSIEDNQEYVGKYNKRENYIYAPMAANGWYFPEVLHSLPSSNVLFIDGPAYDNRLDMFCKYNQLFDRKAHWFFDDTAHAPFEHGLMEIQRLRGKTLIRFDKCYKQWGVILGD